MARVEVDRVTRDVGSERILHQVSFNADDGEFVTLIGSSGAGKTSLLRLIAGFDELTSGSVRFDGVDVTHVPTRERDIGMVSQQSSLFPHHRVAPNLRFPLRNRGMSRAEARKRVEAESRAHDIDHILERWPATLSGGEQQLVQIARALVRVPRVLLMDEPLARLDAQIQQRLRHEIVELQRGYGVTMIYATNRPEEIVTMPDRVVALDHGQVVQTGPPLGVRSRPATLTIAELTGSISRLDVVVEAAAEGFWLSGDGVRLRAWAPILARWIGRPLCLAVRSEDVRLGSSGPITVTTGAVTFVESRSARQLQCGAGSLHTHRTDLAPDTQVCVTPDRWHLFDDSGQRILSFPG